MKRSERMENSVNVFMPAELIAQLERFAAEEHITRSEAVRQLLRTGLRLQQRRRRVLSAIEEGGEEE